MPRLAPALVLVLLGLLAAAPAARADHPGEGGYPLTTTLTGAEEVRVGDDVPVLDAGDRDGTGSAALRLNPGQEEICYDLAVSGIAEPLTGAHIHVAPAGANGPVVVPLTPPTGGASSGCVPAPRELILAIIRNPEQYYVTVPNAAYPGGALRGQLGD